MVLCRNVWILLMPRVRGFKSEMLLLVLTMTSTLASAGKSWSNGHEDSNHVDVSGPKSHLQQLEVVCSKDHMTVHMHFDEPFYGVVFSHGGPKHERCVHVGPRAGSTSVSFDIMYDSCGTVEHLSGRFHENTIVIQFDEDILEAWDEAKRLRCEWLESFEKQSSKPTLAISDLDVVELNFQGDDIDCWMEVQEGKGPWSRQVGGLVPIGSPLTLVIAINDHSREFDMRIKRCSASDGKGSEIELTDHNGCVIRPKLLTPFAKVRDFGAKATLVAYSHIYAFKFPDKMDVFVHCIVEVCRHGCPDSCGHQSKSHHASGSGTFDILESKKIEKLANFSNSKSVHEIHVSGHHHQALKTSNFGGGLPLPGRVRNREELVPAAQTQVHHIALKNASFTTKSHDGRIVIQDLATFKPPALLKDVKKEREKQTQMESAPSNVHPVFVDMENSLQADKNSKPNPPQYFSHDSQSVPTAHRIIGHDVHWISEPVKKIEDQQSNSEVPSLKDITYQAPQPEIATWSADEIKSLLKHELFQSKQAPKPEPATWSADEVKSLLKHEVFQAKQAPKPEPASWSADEVTPLSKPEIFQVKPVPKPVLDSNVPHFHSNSPHVSKIHWATDDRKPHESLHALLQKIASPVPQPEPAPWTFEEVNPMHSPEVIRLQLHTKPPEVPKPEPGPSSWTFDDVKGLSKENLRFLSLNHKMKSHSPINAPVYQEFVRPYSTSTIPQPVFVTKYPLSPRNMSSLNMMKTMMMMPTMLPVTYQTALWPQRATTRFLRPHRHHYPYPVPQFSPHQQMMMSIIADRRMDEDSQESSENLPLHHNLDGNAAESHRIKIGETASSEKSESKLTLDDTKDDSLLENISLYHSLDTEVTEPRRIQIGETVRSRTSESEITLNNSNIQPDAMVDTLGEITLSDITPDISSEEGVMIGKTFTDQVTSESKPSEGLPSVESVSVSEPVVSSVTVEVYELTTTSKDLSSVTVTNLGSLSGVRPAISSFVPPSLDADMGANPEESKGRVVPGPRSLDRKKRSSEPVFGVRQKFQAIAPSDLAFEWNLTSESATVFRGHREEIVYGICISPAGMTASVGFILILTLLSIIVSVVLYEHSCQLSNKTSQLSFFTKNFNGQFEALYKFTRPYLYTDNRNIR